MLWRFLLPGQGPGQAALILSVRKWRPVGQPEMEANWKSPANGGGKHKMDCAIFPT